jgi:hypothetical protein
MIITFAGFTISFLISSQVFLEIFFDYVSEDAEILPTPVTQSSPMPGWQDAGLSANARDETSSPVIALDDVEFQK